ncbi:O-antigen ligase family protein [Synechocystis sp. LKSZ1]|uniref:O-antigen ligase family protein n=1 Tax=Synechocystis sp. LKSZ1 TaxID=3144951 RepID=UPI00336BB7DD
MSLTTQAPVSPAYPREWRAIQWGILWLPFNPIMALLGLLFALFSLWKQAFRPLVATPMAKGFALLSVWLVLTTLMAEHKGEALLGLANFLPYFALFLAYRLVFRHFSQLRYLAWILSLSALVLVILGLGQIYGGWATPAWLSVLGTNLVAEGRPEGRMSSLLMYANLFSAHLLMVLPLSLGLLIDQWRFGQALSDKAHWRGLAGLGLICFAEIVALFLTDSRSAWGLTALILVAYALYLSWYRLVALIAGGAGLVLWSAFGPWGREPLRQIIPRYFWARLSDELYPDRYKTAFRSTQWDFALQMLSQRPLTGWGLRNFTPLYQAAMNVWLGHPHSLPLMLLAEIGIPGTLLFLGLVGSVLYQATRLCWRLGQRREHKHRQRLHLLLFAYLLAFGSVTLFNLFDVTLFDLRVNLLGWILLSAIAGVSQGPFPRPTHDDKLST